MSMASGNRVFLFLSILVGLVLFVAPSSFAQTSTNYRIWTDVIAGGGGESASPNYLSFSTLGQPSPLGPSNSNGYFDYPGLIYSLEGIPINSCVVDFNGDGKSDIVWRNIATGRTTIWYLDGVTWNGGFADVEPTLSDPNWSIVGVADFNGDNHPDLLWRNTSTGRTTIWYMDGPAWNGGYADVLPTLNDPNWSIVGIADFNKDGNPDLLWRDASTGRTTIWYMTGPTWNGGFADVLPTLNDPNWSIVGLADFNGDSNPDLLWRDASTGRTTIWYMSGPTWNGGYADVLPTLSDPDWQIVAIRDFNNDRSPDLLWRNTSSNPANPNAYRTTVWYMDGPVWNGTWGDLLPTVSDPNWIIVGR